jgi:cytochrome P450
MNPASNPPDLSPIPQRTGPFRFPAGLKHNLLWYILGKFRPGDPIGLFQYLAREYGDIAHYKLGPHHIIFLNHPEYIREVLVVQNDNFIKERTVQRSKLLLGEGMITSEGSAHRMQRHAAQPAFHRQRVSTYAQQMVSETMSAQASWRNGQAIDLAQEMMRLTLRIVSKTLFDTMLGNEVHELTQAINDIMGLYHYLIALPAVDLLIHLGIPGIAGFAKAKSKIDSIVYEMIENHRRSGPGSNDLLDMMLGAEEAFAGKRTRSVVDEYLRDQVITIFLAGYETVANALIWTWYLLSQHPVVEENLHREIDGLLEKRVPSIDDVPSLRYVEAVLAESMRLYPPAWAMGRRARENFALREYWFPGGTTVLMSQFVTHRDSRNFSNPLNFEPARFLSRGRSTFPKFVYFPFGAGPRQCIGEAFAWTEGILVIAAIAQRWRLRLVPSQRIEAQPLITLRSKYGMMMQLEMR